MRKRQYTAEFRAEAVKAAMSEDRTIKEVAQSLGISYWTLREWKKEYLESQGEKRPREKMSSDEEVRVLRKQNAELQMDNAILKKYAAMLSREL